MTSPPRGRGSRTACSTRGDARTHQTARLEKTGAASPPWRGDLQWTSCRLPVDETVRLAGPRGLSACDTSCPGAPRESLAGLVEFASAHSRCRQRPRSSRRSAPSRKGRTAMTTQTEHRQPAPEALHCRSCYQVAARLRRLGGHRLRGVGPRPGPDPARVPHRA